MASLKNADKPCCCIKELPESLQKTAASSAVTIFPANAPGVLFAGEARSWQPPSNLVALTLKLWGPQPKVLTVSFLESPASDLRARILEHMNAWKCSVTFRQAQPGTPGQVRISLSGEGYWSYLGTDILHVPLNQPTMNLQGFNMNTPELEYKRVVRHETGHTLGFPHEQLREEIVSRIDKAKAYEYFKDALGWDEMKTNVNVLEPLTSADLRFTPTADNLSIMCYQLPSCIMHDGKAVEGGLDIDAADYAFCQQLYPLSPVAPKTLESLVNLPGLVGVASAH